MDSVNGGHVKHTSSFVQELESNNNNDTQIINTMLSAFKVHMHMMVALFVNNNILHRESVLVTCSCSMYCFNLT